MYSIKDCQIVDLPKIHNEAGNITSLENWKDIPFKVKRIYYLYDVPMGVERGGHGHYELEQYVIAASGSFTFVLDDGINKIEFFLNDPSKALHIKAGIWREIKNFSSGSICLVLASEEYDENDYLRNYDEFKTSRGLSGILTKLVPVNLKDAKFICSLRNNPFNNKFLSSSKKINLNQQIKWLDENFKTKDLYFIIKNKTNSIGTISLYNLNTVNGEFGRYICLNPLNALESVYLLLKHAFEILNLEYVYCKTVKENEKVWKQHIKFGFEFEGIEFNEGNCKEMIVQRITKEIYSNYDYNWLFDILKKLNK